MVNDLLCCYWLWWVRLLLLMLVGLNVVRMVFSLVFVLVSFWSGLELVMMLVLVCSLVVFLLIRVLCRVIENLLLFFGVNCLKLLLY